MKTKFALAVLALSLLLSCPVFADIVGKKRGEAFPDLTLAGSISDQDRQYLGLGGVGPWSLGAIGSKAVLVEVFSMYCPYCQKEAPKVNELHALIESSGLGSDVKLIGIGAGNTQFEVDFFRKKYQVSFPLFIDPDLTVHSATGKVGTPYFALIGLREGKEHVTLFSHLGPFEDTGAFLEQLRKALNDPVK
jgi:thiol-disulfide isomerase/thioredoxin